MNIDSGDIVHIPGDVGEGGGMDTGVGGVMTMVEDILIFMVTIGNILQKWKNLQQETDAIEWKFIKNVKKTYT